MEFVRRNKKQKKQSKPENLMDYAPDDLVDEDEKLWEAHEARAYKYEAQAAMSQWSMKNQHEFANTFKRYLNNTKRLRDIRDGTVIPFQESGTDYQKVRQAVAIQSINLGIAIVCISLGVWPVVLFTLPAFLGLNYYWLVKDQNQRTD